MNQEQKNESQSPEQNQNQAGPGPGLPEVMQQESPRKCKICGGPNHHGCGCEARQRAAAVVLETEHIEITSLQHKPGEPTSEKDDVLEDILSPDAIREAHEAQMKSYKDIETIAAGNEGLCACMYDITNYLKLITGDLITIRKHLTNEDEVKDDTDKNQN